MTGDVFVRVQETRLDLSELILAVEHPSAGGLVTFSGVVRDHHDGKRGVAIGYEAYGKMAEAKMRQIADDVRQRWPECRIAIAHRTGDLQIGEASVMIAVSAPHR